ncbi:dihydroneopterin aldolase [Mucilaginibacter myungsuensis]|uniref:7,8-dihydroneopterin aldolase n=1 Tax=Mucilaginibacter myungsuensis TaxID=649104 RepID=A0A929KZH2_9SPHI|nr:dihydroneopterin aldolase [Mucilaginibacter myungsuensis]MBE9664571.1 dihydroneopterin aldolase [Mucilaginibacter myungsuensis]MDN3601079.1 dihydroneopterin aldolase [Mucilaginibacter myungsuensis]
MITVSLHGAEFFAYHGFYPEEQLLGNKFIIDIYVDFETDADLSADELSDTVNYEQLYNIAKEEMAKTAKLLETVAHNITKRIRDEHPYLLSIRVALKKLNPPLQGRVAHSAVTITV